MMINSNLLNCLNRVLVTISKHYEGIRVFPVIPPTYYDIINMKSCQYTHVHIPHESKLACVLPKWCKYSYYEYLHHLGRTHASLKKTEHFSASTTYQY